MFPLERDGGTPTSPIQAVRALESSLQVSGQICFPPALEGALAASST